MEWVGAFAGNLSDGLFWPFIFLSVVALGVATQAFFERTDREYPYASQGYGDTTWRMHAAMQGLVGMWLVWALVNAVPEPNYIYRTKTVEVVKTVTKTDTYTNAYEQCMEAHHKSGQSAEEDSKICEPVAQQLVLGKPFVVEKQVIKAVPLAREVRYRTLFNTCMGKDVQEGGWTIAEDENTNGEEARDRRIQLCHAQTKEVIDG